MISHHTQRMKVVVFHANRPLVSSLATAVGITVGSAIPVPIVGTLVGGLIGYGVGKILDVLGSNVRGQMKSLVD